LKLGIRGIKVHPPHQGFAANAYREGLEGLADLYRLCEAEGVPLMVHTGTSIFPGARNVFADPLPCDDIAVDFPDLRLIVAHGGRPIWMDTAFFLVRRHPNFFLDLSSIPPQSLLDYFPRLASISDKLLFGSDWPGPGVPDIGANVRKFQALALAPETRRKALYDNAAALFPVLQ
jgi:predicted TIM-barrel fold metal-dependent hydrolase